MLQTRLRKRFLAVLTMVGLVLTAGITPALAEEFPQPRVTTLTEAELTQLREDLALKDNPAATQTQQSQQNTQTENPTSNLDPGTPNPTSNLDAGTTQAGTLADPHAATAQLKIGPTRETCNSGQCTVPICSAVWVGPGRLLTAAHCFENLQSGTYQIQIFDTDSRAGRQPVALGTQWATPGKDIAVVFTDNTSHAYARVNGSGVRPGEQLFICGQNYLVQASNNINQNSVVEGGRGNFCGAVNSLTADQQRYWAQYPSNGVLATVPLVVEHGDSGGPLYNASGEVVGVTSTKTRVAWPDGRGSLLFNSSVPVANHVEWLVSRGVNVYGVGVAGLQLKELPVNLTRIAGDTRYDTSSQVVAASPGAETLIVASGRVAADGLAATQLTGVTSAAVMLSAGREALDPAVVNAIKSGTYKRVVRVGGTAGLSAADRALISGRGMQLVELVGQTRFDTAVRVARYRDQLAQAAGKGGVAKVFLADGISFPDALAAGAAAGGFGRGRAGAGGASLVLTSGATMPAETLAYLRESGASVATVGGPAQRAAVAAGLNPSEVYTGADRYQTALLLLQSQGPGFGLVLVSGRDFPDALAAGAYTVKQGARLALVPPAGSQPGLLADAWAAAGGHGVIVGGRAAVSDQDVAWAVSR